MAEQEMVIVYKNGKEVGSIPASNEQLHRDLMSKQGEGQFYSYKNLEQEKRNLEAVEAIKQRAVEKLNKSKHTQPA